MQNVKTRRKNQSDNKRLQYEHQCAICKGWFPASNIDIDHIKAEGHLTSESDFGAYCVFLFFGKLQKVCKPCHKVKTKTERGK